MLVSACVYVCRRALPSPTEPSWEVNRAFYDPAPPCPAQDSPQPTPGPRTVLSGAELSKASPTSTSHPHLSWSPFQPQLPLPGKLLHVLQSQAEWPPPPGGLPNLDSEPARPTTAQESWPATASPKASVWPHTAPLSGPNTAWHTGDPHPPNS